MLYFNLNNTKLSVHVKITKANGKNIEVAVAGLVNLGLHSLFPEISIELNGRPVGEPNKLYPYRAYIETICNYCQEVQKTRLLFEGLVKITLGKIKITDVAGENDGLKEKTK